MTPPTRIVIATENIHKGREITAILRRFLPVDILIQTLLDLPEQISLPDETGTTFCENAVVKAEAVAEALGVTALGDDSGLCVAAIGGAPGLRSRRWEGVADSDAARNAALLEAMASVPEADRIAEFVCCVAVAIPGKDTMSAVGACRGIILLERRGSMGFGYDPLFLVEGTGLTMAELTEKQKNLWSHRALAIEKLLDRLGWFGSTDGGVE